MEVFFVILAIAAYFLPSIIGWNRGVVGSFPLFLINLLLGWTVIGWLVTLAWSVIGRTKAEDEFYRRQTHY